MKYCPKHDITFPDGGTCWCCDKEKTQASLADQESESKSALDAAAKALQAAEVEAKETSVRVQATLDQRVVDAKAALEQAITAADTHRATMPPAPAPEAPAPAA